MLVLGAAMAIYGYQNGASMSLYWADGHVYTEKDFDSLAESEEWTELPEGVSGLALELNNADVTIRQGDVFHISADYQRGSAPEATVKMACCACATRRARTSALAFLSGCLAKKTP